jgi:isocitrate dehydrogenase
MVYISGEEMTHYATQLLIEQWIKPYFDISSWETYDLSCKSRDETEDKVLGEAVEAGKRVGAIFKEPTITPSAIQVQEMGLKKVSGQAKLSPGFSLDGDSLTLCTVIFARCVH